MKAAPLVPRRRQTGQAMTEMVVVCVILVPLFLLIPVVAKYGHLRQQSMQATRNAAWDMTATDSHALRAVSQLRDIARDRVFADADARILSAPSVTADAEFDSPMVNTFSGRHLVLREDVAVTNVTESSSPGFVSGLASRLPAGMPGEFPPNRNGYVRVETRWNIRDLQTSDGAPARYLAPFDNLGISMEAHQVLLVDAWNAAGSGQRETGITHRRSVMSQVDSFVPTSNLRGVGDHLQRIGQLPLPIIGKLRDLDIGYIEPDIVPIDRLEPYAGNVD